MIPFFDVYVCQCGLSSVLMALSLAGIKTSIYYIADRCTTANSSSVCHIAMTEKNVWLLMMFSRSVVLLHQVVSSRRAVCDIVCDKSLPVAGGDGD